MSLPLALPLTPETRDLANQIKRYKHFCAACPHCSIKWNKTVKILKNFVDVALNGGTYGYQSSPNKNQSREVLDGLFSNLRTRFLNTNLNHFLNLTHALTLNAFDILGTYFLALCRLLTPFLRLVGRIHIVSLAGQESCWMEKSSWDKNLRLMKFPMVLHLIIAVVSMICVPVESLMGICVVFFIGKCYKYTGKTMGRWCWGNFLFQKPSDSKVVATATFFTGFS